MLKYTWVVLYGIFYTAAAGITFGKLNGKDKSVNLALETVFEFGDEDKKGDVNLLSNVQKFIGKVKNVIENSNGGRRHLSDENERFTSFIIDVIRILKQYDDQDLEQVAYIVSDGIKKYHRKGSQLHNLTKSLSIHDIVAKKLGEIKKKSAIDIREYLDSVAKKIRKEKYLKHEKLMLDAINSVYTADSTIKLNSFLTDLDDYRGKARKNMDLSKIINHGLKYVFFDHLHYLNINKKSLLLSDLNEAFGQLSANFNKITAKNIEILYSQPVTKTTKALRTSRQMFVEKDIDMQYIKNDFDKWMSEGANKEGKTKHGRKKDKTRGILRGKSLDKTRTPVTQRPHNVPTTRKPSYEYKNDALRTYENKKHRFLKVSNEQSSPKYKKRKTETTTQYRTYRQMYVEKNIDLKYNADAYENLTTANKVRTTRKHIRNTYKDEGDSYERHSDEEETMKPQYVKEHGTDEESEESGQNTKNEKEVEGVLSDLMIELSTEVHVPSITKSPKVRVTRMRRFSGETLIDKNIDYAEDIIPRFRSNRKGFAYSTPGFLIDWSTKKPRILERILPRGSIENRELKIHRAEEKRKDLKKNKDMDYSNEVNKDKYLERYRKNKQNYRNKADDHSKYYTRDSRVHLGKITKRYHGDVPILTQERESLRGNPKMSRSPLILAKHYGGSHQFGKKYFRRANSQAPKISEEGLSIQADDNTNNRKSHRRYDNSDTPPKIDGDKQVLERLQKLEHELEIVKTQIKNDTNAVRDLIKNSRNDKTNENKVTQLQKAIIDLHSKPNLDIEAVTQLKSINTGGFNIEIPETYNKNVYDINKQSLDLTKRKEYDSYRVPYENPSTVGNIIQNVNIEEHGRKAFPDLKNVVKSDELKTYEKPSNLEAINNTPIKDIEKTSVTSKIKEAESNNSQTYKGSLKNRPEQAVYFRVNDDSNENTFNVTAYETLKDKYSSSQIKNEANQNLNDTKELNNQATAIGEEEQLNEDSQTKATTTQADFDDHVANIAQSNSSKELKHDENVDNNRDISDKNNKTGLDLTTKVDELSKLSDESITKSDKIVTVTSVNNLTTAIVPGTNTLPGNLMNQPDVNDGNIVQRSVDKEATDGNLLPSTLKSDGVKNETLPIQQNVLKPDIEHPVSVYNILISK